MSRFLTRMNRSLKISVVSSSHKTLTIYKRLLSNISRAESESVQTFTGFGLFFETSKHYSGTCAKNCSFLPIYHLEYRARPKCDPLAELTLPFEIHPGFAVVRVLISPATSLILLTE